jgi:hypothetical protein
MGYNQCIICLEKCNNSICICNAYYHDECLKKWNDSIYNLNKSKCPHCRNEIYVDINNSNSLKIKIRCNFCNSVYIYFINFCNSVYIYFINFIFNLINICEKCFLYIYYLIILLCSIIIFPFIIGGILFSISSGTKNINELCDYLIHNIMCEWFVGIIILIIVLHIWAKCKMNECNLDDDF